MKLIRILKDVGLAHLLKPEFHNAFVNEEHMILNNDIDSGYYSEHETGLDIIHGSGTWETMLSPGEVQRLLLGRVLFWEPKYAILDESTSSLNSEMALEIYEKLSALNTTLISITHNDRLLQFHKLKLNLNSDTSYELTSI
ncbi:ATP-binding cassette sub-family D member 4 [Smittium culicis]|uniref:ATP-binding cassette sub-family D member 4 n=1 Tax=Smittium culicis TaxID=133412 RepID=A0A1R1Y657_9FUNG|nr:ATP-binding cassette sub-family D member 4 [Smittium culicis]